MKIAVPTAENEVDSHFGHCDHYTIFEIDDNKKIVNEMYLPAGQGCGCKSNISSILNNLGVRVMLAGNMGEGAKNVLESANIEVIRGCTGNVNKVVEDYLNDGIEDSGIGCSSSDHDGCGH